MQIEKESSNKIKVILQSTDLREMNISVENLRPNSPQLNRFLYEIMERVREETGFNPYSGQIVVEAVPGNGGVVLTVTRLGKPERTLNKAALKNGSFKAVIKKHSKTKTAYCFDSFDDLCKVLTILDKDTLNKSDYYKMDNKNILVLCGASAQEKYILKEYSSCFKNGIIFESYLSEHGKHVAGGDSLVSMADGISKLLD